MKKILKGLGILLGALVVVIGLAGAGGYFVSQSRLDAKVTAPTEHVAVPTDSISIARGGHLARAIAKCVDCHGDDLGGQVIAEAPPIGRLVSANITTGKGGRLAQLGDDDIVRAVRHAVSKDGRKLMMMPASDYSNLSAEDLGAIIAWVRSRPPVDRELPPFKVGPVLRGLIVAGQLPVSEADVVDHSKPIPTAPMAGPTLEYGKYIVSTGGCIGCHGKALSGGPIPGGDPSWPPAANITPTGLKAYDEAAFFTALREGVRPGGGKINPAMPYRLTKEMTDDEIRAVWAYLKTVPAKEFKQQ